MKLGYKKTVLVVVIISLLYYVFGLLIFSFAKTGYQNDPKFILSDLKFGMTVDAVCNSFNSKGYTNPIPLGCAQWDNNTHKYTSMFNRSYFSGITETYLIVYNDNRESTSLYYRRTSLNLFVSSQDLYLKLP